MWAMFLRWLGGGPLSRILDTVDHKVDNETERQKIKAGVVQTFAQAQVTVLTGKGWWFPILFITPLGFWFASVCVYSVFFCADCMAPQAWTIAALPPPLDEWSGAIISSLFVGKFGLDMMRSWKR
jgi:hypothetical protein